MIEGKLKTLKDIECDSLLHMPLHKAYVSNLKIEAIKWIKEIRRSNPIERMGGGFTEAWIKHFFNITDEDIEEEKK